MLKTIKLSIFFGLFLFTLTTAQGVFAQAVNPNRANTNNANPAVENMNDRAQVAQNKVGSDDSSMVKNNLSEARLRVCEARQERIATRFRNLQSLGARAHQNYSGFVDRVDYYYTNTLALQGYTLENYAELKADITSNEQAVNLALEQVNAVGQEFSCNAEDPKGQADAFRTNMQEVISANKNYRDSVRAFVIAVRDLAREARTATLSESPEVSPIEAEGVEE